MCAKLPLAAEAPQLVRHVAPLAHVVGRGPRSPGPGSAGSLPGGGFPARKLLLDLFRAAAHVEPERP